ncbi:MAG: hypothetical protein WBX15_03350 [Thermoanaerobaculia bacterium]
MIWREKRWLIISLGILLLINLVFFFTYRLRYQQRIEDLQKSLDHSRTELATAHKARVSAEKQLAGLEDVEKNIRTVHEEIWSTPDRRLTSLITEIRKLAVQSQIHGPDGINYAQLNTKSETRILGIAFGVRGTYDQIRRFLNLLELSDQFVIIDQITLSGQHGAELQLSIGLKTLFDDPAASSAPNRRRISG